MLDLIWLVGLIPVFLYGADRAADGLAPGPFAIPTFFGASLARCDAKSVEKLANLENSGEEMSGERRDYCGWR